MKIDNISSMVPGGGLSSGKAAALQKQIQGLHREVGKLKQKKQLTEEEQKRKQELEEQIARLQRELSQAKAEEKKQKTGPKRGGDENREPTLRPGEEGLGENVDKYL